MSNPQHRLSKTFTLSPKTVWTIQERAIELDLNDSRALDVIIEEWAEKKKFSCSVMRILDNGREPLLRQISDIQSMTQSLQDNVGNLSRYL